MASLVRLHLFLDCADATAVYQLTAFTELQALQKLMLWGPIFSDTRLSPCLRADSLRHCSLPELDCDSRLFQGQLKIRWHLPRLIRLHLFGFSHSPSILLDQAVPCLVLKGCSAFSDNMCVLRCRHLTIQPPNWLRGCVYTLSSLLRLMDLQSFTLEPAVPGKICSGDPAIMRGSRYLQCIEALSMKGSEGGTCAARFVNGTGNSLTGS